MTLFTLSALRAAMSGYIMGLLDLKYRLPRGKCRHGVD